MSRWFLEEGSIVQAGQELFSDLGVPPSPGCSVIAGAGLEPLVCAGIWDTSRERACLCALHNPGYRKEDSSSPGSAVEQDRFVFCSVQIRGRFSSVPVSTAGTAVSSLQENDGMKRFFLGRAAFLL